MTIETIFWFMYVLIGIGTILGIHLSNEHSVSGKNLAPGEIVAGILWPVFITAGFVVSGLDKDK